MIRLSCKRRGVATVIGAVFFVMIMFMVVGSVIVDSMRRQAIYDQVSMEMSELDRIRDAEEMRAFGNYTVYPTSVSVVATLYNKGPTPINVITILVEDKTKNVYGIKSVAKPIPQAGIASINETIVVDKPTAKLLSSDDAIAVFFITSLGNKVLMEPEYLAIAPPDILEILGPVVSKKGSFAPSVIKKGTTTTWRLNVTNYAKTDITLRRVRADGGTSGLMVVKIDAPGTGGSIPLDADYLLKRGEMTTIYFKGTAPTVAGTYAVFVILLGEYADGKLYSQNIPFEVLVITA